jgi:hypothetical protein
MATPALGSSTLPTMARPISKTTKFILSLPKTLSVREVLAKAKAGGMKTSESNIHRVRRLHRKGSKATTKHKSPARAAKSARPAKTRGASAESLLRAVAAEIGLARAVEIVQEEWARIRAVLRR